MATSSAVVAVTPPAGTQECPGSYSCLQIEQVRIDQI